MAFFLLNRLFENSQSNRYSNRYPRIDSPINIRYIFYSVYVNDNCFSNVDSGKNVLLTCWHLKPKIILGVSYNIYSFLQYRHQLLHSQESPTSIEACEKLSSSNIEDLEKTDRSHTGRRVMRSVASVVVVGILALWVSDY